MRIASFFALIMPLGLITPAYAETIEVKIDNFTFNPPQLTVHAGDTVTWVNHDDIPHMVMSKGQGFRSKVLDSDDKFSFTFAAPGTFLYFCSLHPHMTGSIVVEAAAK
jgi:plastocyanin